MIEDLIRRIILNGTVPVMDEVYRNLLLTLGFLCLTIIIEVAGFWILFRRQHIFMASKDPKISLFNMLCWIVFLNIITFFIGSLIYWQVVAA